MKLFKAILVIAFIGLVQSACAAPEEIQVYLDEFNSPGEFGLDLHNNYVTASQSGVASSNLRMLRVTPELSYGINKNWELGAYWLTSKGPNQDNNQWRSDGIKARVKWRPDSSADAEANGSPWYWAANLELGNLNTRFDPDQRTGELKLIGVWKKGNWTLGGNFNFDRALNAGTVLGTTTEFDSKLMYHAGSFTDKPFQIGLENYAYRGAIAGPLAGANTNNTLFLAADFSIYQWDLNLGIGRANGVIDDKTILKAIVGVPF